MQLGLGSRVHLRDADTLDDLCDVTAPAPVEPGDLVASAENVYRVGSCSYRPVRRSCPVLGRRVEPAIADVREC